mgnify:CR=1 FL=1
MRVLFVFCFLFLSAFSNAQNQLNKNIQNKYYLAETYYREGEYEKAEQLFKELYKKSPFNINYLNRLISCYQETNQFLAAENLIKQKLKKNPNEQYLYVYLGYNFDRQDFSEQAKENYKKAIESISAANNFGALIGRSFKEYNLLDYAILAYERTMDLNENANYNFQIAQIYGEKGEFKKMFDAYVDLVDKNKSFLNLVQRYTSRYITEDAEEETNILFKKALLKKSISKPKSEWNILLSWLFSQQKEYKKAFIQEKALYQRELSDLSEIFILGEIAFRNKDLSAAKQCFDFVNEQTNVREEEIEASFYLSQILVAQENDETEEYFKLLFEKFGKNNQTISLQVAYADFLTFSKNDADKSQIILEEALQYANSKFEKAKIKLKLGDVLVYLNNYNKALIYFSQIQTQLKGSDIAQEARFKVAQTSYFKGDFDWAKAQLKVLKGSTTQLIANDAVDLYLKIIDNEPVDSIPTGLKELAKAELLFYQNKNNDALSELNNLLSSKNQSEKKIAIGLNSWDVIYDDALFLKSKILIKEKDFEKAILNLQKIIETDDQSFLIDDVCFMIASIYDENLKNVEKAKEYYQKIIFEHPSSIYLVEARKRFRKLRGDSL